MKKSKLRSQSKQKAPAKLLAALEKQQEIVEQQEARGHFGTYDHGKLARLKTAVAEYQKNEVE